MKKGFYLFRDAVPMIPNVTLRGGFAGTESAAEEADPKANLTVITGDAFGDNTWSGPSAGGRLVWEDGVLNEPNPDGVDVCWKPVGQQATDTQWAFNTDAGAVTNCAFRGLVGTERTGRRFFCRLRNVSFRQPAGGAHQRPEVLFDGVPFSIRHGDAAQTRELFEQLRGQLIVHRQAPH